MAPGIDENRDRPRARLTASWHVSALALLILVFNGLLAAWLLIKPAGHAAVVAVDDVAQSLGPLLALPVVALTIRRARRDASGALVWGPVLLCGGSLLFGAGQAIYTCYELASHASPPLPSWADACFLGAYPFLLLGILLLPTRPLPLAARTRVFVDGLMIMAAVATFSWYFILGPTLLQGNETAAAKVVSTAYPLFDLVLILCLLLLSSRSNDAGTRTVVRVLSVALGVIVCTDSVYDYQNLQGTYATGGLIDVGWPLGYMLVGLGACALYAAMPVRKGADSANPAPAGVGGYGDTSMWRSLLPYPLIPAVGALIVYAARTHGGEAVEAGVYAGGAALIGLVVLRQILAIHEAVSHNRLLRAIHDEVEAKNRALAEANTRLEALATTDPLTGLPNHRAIVAALDKELERVHRYGRPCSVLFLDLDHFKALNDTCGHAAGDTALHELAALTRATLRGVDTLGRWGGEEFVAILPETAADGAATVAEGVRAAVAAYAFSAGGGVRLTLSVGMASCPGDAANRDGLVDAADRAMYAAKRLGRNQVRAAGDPAVAALDGESGSREDVALVGTVEALAALVEARDQYTGEHTNEVARLTARLALLLGRDTADARLIGLAGRLHDVGKIAIPDAVLRKPGRLTEDEWTLIRTHPVVGADVVGRVPALRVLAPLIRAHHERWDGSGYPDGLAGADIPLGARIIAVADAYGAMTTDRPYRAGRDAAWALAELRRCAGAQFDPTVVDALMTVVGSRESGVGRGIEGRSVA